MRYALLALLLGSALVAAPVPRPRVRPVPAVTPGMYRFVYAGDEVHEMCLYVRLRPDGSYEHSDRPNAEIPAWYGRWWYDRESHTLHVHRTKHGYDYTEERLVLMAGWGPAKWAGKHDKFAVYQGWGVRGPM